MPGRSLSSGHQDALEPVPKAASALIRASRGEATLCEIRSLKTLPTTLGPCQSGSFVTPEHSRGIRRGQRNISSAPWVTLRSHMA